MGRISKAVRVGAGACVAIALVSMAACDSPTQTELMPQKARRDGGVFIGAGHDAAPAPDTTSRGGVFIGAGH